MVVRRFLEGITSILSTGPIPAFSVISFLAMDQRRDPWAPFRFWVALTIAAFALRAVSLTSPLAPLRRLADIPGWVLLLMVLAALLLAAAALLFPGRIEPWREGEPGLWAEISADWRHRWRRLRGTRQRGKPTVGAAGLPRHAPREPNSAADQLR